MKQKFQILVSIFLAAILSTSCIFMTPSINGDGNVVEENRKVGDFDEIKVSRGMNVYISQGEKIKVVVKADENLLDAIETRIEGDVLKITSNKNIRKATTKKVYVTLPKIKRIKASAGSNVFSQSTLKSKNLRLSGSAGSNMKIEVDCGKMDVSVSAGSNMMLEGKASSFLGKASAGSNLKAEGLISKKCQVKTSSGANIWISVKNNLTAQASSGGNIFYYGNPETTDVEKSSGGNVIKK
jgi:hypothetical protein